MTGIRTIQHETYQKRIPQTIDTRKDITRYDTDNLYPQRVEQIAFRSPICDTSVKITADFLNGEGFSENPDFIVDAERGTTINELLWQASQDFSPFNGFGILLNFNMLGEIVQMTHTRFKYIRFGLPDRFGRHKDVKVNINWEQDPHLLPDGQKAKTFTFPIFDLKSLDEQIESSGSIGKFKGQMLYFTGERDQYPKASYDSVLDSAQLSGDIQAWELSNMQNGFHGSSIFRYPGEFENDRERAKTVQELKAMKGVHGGNSTMLVETPMGTEDFTLLENLPANNNDRLFELTTRNTTERILQAFAMPGPLAGVFPPSGAIFNQNEISDAYVYYNNRVRNRRMLLERVLNDLGANWEGGPVSFGNIIEQKFEVKPEPIKRDGSRDTTDNEN
jgi:hypothetical protein